MQTLLFFEGGKILNEEGSGTARAGCWRVAKQRAGTRPRQQTTVWLQMELWSSCGPGIQAGYPELTLIRSLYEWWTTLNNHSRSHPLSDAAVRASIGLFIILQMRSRVCIIWSLELPWCPWAGPHTVQGGAGCGWRLPTNYPQWWQVPDLDFRQIIKNISEKSDHPFAPDDQMSEGEDCCAHLYRVLCLMLVRFLLCFCTHNITLKVILVDLSLVD